MRINDITSAIIGAAIEVHRHLGPGLLESAYRNYLAHELQLAGWSVQQEQPIPVVYKGLHLDCGYKSDLYVQRLVLVECKAKEKLHPVDKAQILSHLRLMRLEVGLLINFHEEVLKDGIHRIANNYRE